MLLNGRRHASDQCDYSRVTCLLWDGQWAKHTKAATKYKHTYSLLSLFRSLLIHDLRHKRKI